VEGLQVADRAVRTLRDFAPLEPGNLQKGKGKVGVGTRFRNLAPQVGLEPTTLRLTAELHGEAVRIKKCKLLKIRAQWSCSHAALRMAFNKSSYKSSYSPFGWRYCRRITRG
jgi:hypothetical protein